MEKLFETLPQELRPTRVAPGIVVFPFRTPTLLPATATNTTFFDGKEIILVDPATPYRDEQARFDRLLGEYQAQGKPLGAVILTHHHYDHVADAERVSRAFHMPIWAHRYTADRVDFPVARLLEDGDEIELSSSMPMILQVLFTPGHAPGHICLLEKNTKTLVAGDMIASTGSILIDPVDGHLATYLASLQRLLGVNPACVIPAHGLPLVDGPEQIQYTYNHRLLRVNQVFDELPDQEQHAATVDGLIDKIYRDQVPDSSLPFAHLSLVSTLVFLIEQDRIKCDSQNQYFWRSR